MKKTLLRIQFKAMMASWMGKRRKKGSKGSSIGMAALFIYLIVVFLGMFAAMFNELVVPYHQMGYDWVYFAMAGIMALALSVFGSVFSTQTQLYESKDNDLLLSMPVLPGDILLCRMVPLLVVNQLFGAMVMLPAGVVYALQVGVQAPGVVGFVICMLTITLIAQAVSCILGWGLHLLLSRINKAAASVVYMIVFLAIYFTAYSQVSQILALVITQGEQIASALRTWAWPLYAMGMGCVSSLLHGVGFALFAMAVFGAVYAFLSANFVKTATLKPSAKKKKAVKLDTLKSGSPMKAILFKELRRFITSPVYLTNMGLGIILLVGMTVASAFVRGAILEVLESMNLDFLLPIVLAAVLSFMISTMCISTPSVSLEGKSLWMLRSMPLSGRQVILGKLGFHCLMTMPLSAVCGAAMALIFGCSWAAAALLAVLGLLLTLFNGVLGMLFGMKLAKFDWINEAYPCKQSVAVFAVMMLNMLIPVVLMALFFTVCYEMQPELFLLAVSGVFAVLNGVLFWLLLTWGPGKWEKFV